MQDSDEKLLRQLGEFARRILPRCPPNIDPHHFGTLLSACQYLEIAREVARLTPADRPLLDWGAGFGHVSFLLASLGCRVEAYDVTDEFVDIDAELLNTPGVHFTRADPGEPLPYEAGSFDTVISVGTLEHVDAEDEALDELHRVLRPHGRLLIYHLPNRHSWVEFLARRTGRFAHDRTYTRSGCREILARHAFETERIRPYHFLPRSSFSRYGPLRRFSERQYRLVDRFDDLLARTPPLSLLATAFTIHARRA